jgi:predicted small lipoprotein YifL
MLDLHRILGGTACAGRKCALAALLGGGLLLAGCGQKGPLFLPAAKSATPPAAVESNSSTYTDSSNATTGR